MYIINIIVVKQCLYIYNIYIYIYICLIISGMSTTLLDSAETRTNKRYSKKLAGSYVPVNISAI